MAPEPASNASPAIRFGWFIPTAGDTTAIGDRSADIPPSMAMFERVALAAERAGFEYALVPVQTLCYEAWIACAMISAKTTRLKMLVAARPGFIAPTLAAKMIATFDQLSGGRVFINLIAGGSAAELAADGCYVPHDERYEMMDETVALMKRVWTEAEPVTHHGKHFQVDNANVHPKPVQQPHPPFFLGGMSDAAKEVSAKHTDVHLFWGDTPQKIAEEMADIRARAARHGRGDTIRFGMRLQVIVREREEDAWAAADHLIASASDNHKRMIADLWEQSQANTRMKALGAAADFRIAPHLWSGITTVRPGAGVAVVGNPAQVAATLQEFVDIGCTDFCLSGYPHDTAAEDFGRLVMPYFRPQQVAAE
ncbi:LLM class flavin-dependent oxidoreductase [Zavarzinia sp. CC-PAN008]|uniref:LLM class flavin-dependent oxidoreductase n=1 Tax=Zavarzinia sp. CC-PAN008 TaxID=3243332 RepID=UPI003F747DA2